jgi:hypothetical protein
MMNRYLAFLVLLLPWLATAAHVEFDYRNSAMEAQGVRFVNLYPLYVYDTNNILVTRDRISRPTLAAGTCTVSNLLRGTYRAEFQGFYTVTTNWFQFPETNGTINAWLYRTNSAFGSVPTNGIFATLADLTNCIAASGVSSFNTRTGAVVLASNDVITALGYAPGTGSGSGITNGQSGVWFPSLSASNSLTIRAGPTNPTPVLNWGRHLSLLPPLYVAGGLSWDTNDDGTFSFRGGHLAGDGAGLTNLNASALASGTVPVERLSGITSNELDAATWELATNTTPGWKLTEPGYVGGTNTFEPVYSLSAGANLWLTCATNAAASGLYTLDSGTTNGVGVTRIYLNAQGHSITYLDVDVDILLGFTDDAGKNTWPTNTDGWSLGFPEPLAIVTGSYDASLYWTTNYTFGGFGVNGSTPSDGAVLAFGQGLDYATNGVVWTIYATNITEACLSSNVWYWATNGGTGGNEAGLIGLTNDLLTLTTNAIRQSRLVAAWSTNLLLFGKVGTNLNSDTNVLGLWLTNGFAGATYTNLGAVYDIVCSPDYTNWSTKATNVPVAMGMVVSLGAIGTTPDQLGVTNLVIYTWDNPALYGLTNDLAGQLLEVDRPKTDRGVVPKKWLNDTTALRVRETNKLWAVNRAVRRVDLEGWPLDLDSQFELVTDRSQSNYFAVNLLDTGDVLAQWRSTNAPARIAQIAAGVWTENAWLGMTPITIFVDTNGLTAAPRIEYATNFNDPQWRPVLNVTNSYPATTNDCYVVRFEPPSSQAAFRASVKGGKALEVFGDVTAETFTGDGGGLTNLMGEHIEGSVARANVAIFASRLYETATNAIVLEPLQGTNLTLASGVRLVGDGAGLTNVTIPVVPEAAVNTNWVYYTPSAGLAVLNPGISALSSMSAGGGGWFKGADQLNGIRLAGSALGGAIWSVPLSQMMAGTNVQLEAQFCTSNDFPFSVWSKITTVDVSSGVAMQAGPINSTNTTTAGTNFWWFRTNFTIPSTNCIGTLTVGNFSANANPAYLTMVRVKITP